jgi:hypothetical protein
MARAEEPGEGRGGENIKFTAQSNSLLACSFALLAFYEDFCLSSSLLPLFVCVHSLGDCMIKASKTVKLSLPLLSNYCRMGRRRRDASETALEWMFGWLRRASLSWLGKVYLATRRLV